MYDGVCADPEIFGALLKLGRPQTFKTKNLPKDEFKDLMRMIWPFPSATFSPPASVLIAMIF
jgi:hypothetical protein